MYVKKDIKETTVNLTQFIHIMAVRLSVDKNDPIHDVYADMVRRLTQAQHNQLFFTIRRIKVKRPPAVYVPRDPHILIRCDLKIIYKYYEAGGSLRDIWKLFFQDRFNSSEIFNYYVHKDYILCRQIEIIDKHRKKFNK